MVKSDKLGFVQMMRPLFWWLLLVLVLFAIHTHERLMKQTRLEFSVSFQGQPIDATATLDGKPLLSGENIALGKHTFAVTFPKADAYSTNLFIWYGPHNLGDIQLKRSMGTLQVKANPPASTVTITGPDFSTNLYDSAGVTLTLPTDQYTVRAEYPHWSQTQNSILVANQMTPCTFSPDLGALYLTCNKDGATYQVKSNGEPVTAGIVPATVTGLPAGKYEIVIIYQNQHMESSAVVQAGVTNELPILWVAGALDLVTVPPGARVLTSDGQFVGKTPLLLTNLLPQTAQMKLSLEGYQPVSITVTITANQTNIYSTNLLSLNYLSSIRAAQMYIAQSNYEAVVQAADAALNAKPDDVTALALKREAEKLGKTEDILRPKRTFDSLCTQYQDAELFKTCELKTSEPAQEALEGIIAELTSGSEIFHIISNHKPAPKIYSLVARLTFSDDTSGEMERDCLVVAGQVNDDETQIWFKMLQYEVQPNGGGVDTKHLIAVSPSRIQMNDELRAQLSEGLQIITEKIQHGINQASAVVQ